MEIKKIKFWYKTWGKRYDDELIVPADFKFCDDGVYELTFIYPYSEEAWKLFHPVNTRMNIYNLCNKYIVGIFGDGIKIHFKDNIEFVNEIHELDNSKFCIRQSREVYDSDFPEGDRRRELLHSTLTIDERIDLMKELELNSSNFKGSTDFCDYRILGMNGTGFRVLKNQYMPIFPTGDNSMRAILFDNIEISNFFSGFYPGASPHIENEWLSIDEFNNKLNETMNIFKSC